MWDPHSPEVMKGGRRTIPHAPPLAASRMGFATTVHVLHEPRKYEQIHEPFFKDSYLAQYATKIRIQYMVGKPMLRRLTICKNINQNTIVNQRKTGLSSS